MLARLIAVALPVLFCSDALGAGNSDMETISGPSFLSIQAAMPAAQKRGLAIGKYRISVFEMDDQVHVVFQDAAQKPLTFGGGFSVTLSQPGLKIVRSGFDQ